MSASTPLTASKQLNTRQSQRCPGNAFLMPSSPANKHILAIFRGENMLTIVRVIQTVYVNGSAGRHVPRHAFIVPPQTSQIVSLVTVHREQMVSVIRIVDTVDRYAGLARSKGGFLVSPPLTNQHYDFVVIHRVMVQSAVGIVDTVDRNARSRGRGSLITKRIQIHGAANAAHAAPAGVLPATVVGGGMPYSPSRNHTAQPNGS